MNIVHFSWEYPPTIVGGLGTFAAELTQRQITDGNKVAIFTLNKDNALKTYEKYHGVNVYRPKLMDLTSTLNLMVHPELQSWGSHFKFFADVMSYNFQSASYLINITKMAKGKSFDIIDAHDWLGIMGGMLAKRELDIPLVFHIHSTESGRSGGYGSQKIKNIEFEGGQVADCIITVSYAMKDELQQLGFPVNKIRVCWNGVDPSKYDPNKISILDKRNLRQGYSIGDNENFLFFIGRLVTIKGVDNLVRAMPNVLKDFPNTKLVILGVGHLENQIRFLINELGLKGNVILRNDFVDEEERILHYATADVVVLPSLYEPFGIVCLEAMAMAKPVVVGARGISGMREQVVPSGENQCGMHINPYEPSDIAWGIKQVLSSKEKTVLMGQNARQRVIDQFSWDAVINRTLEIYREIVN